ncbi:MAG: hypothetical protein M9894_14315 [Planctomycetes bacterium]|nr:hypothetical protein [Planctomycetota bacterium]
MGPRLLCFAGGAALSAFFVHVGLLATPFFGSGAFLWANVFACFLLALAAGFGLGDLFAVAAGRTHVERSAPRLAVVGGLLAWLAAWGSPAVCRWALASDPDWTLAPALAIALVTLLPGALIAAIAPSELRARAGGGGQGGGDGQSGEHGGRSVTGRFGGGGDGRGALRLMGLTSLGGITGIALSGPSLLRADEVDVWLHAYLCGALLVALGLALLGNLARAVGGAGLVGLVLLSALRPSEVQSAQFAVALKTAWREGQGAGLYYRRTLDKAVLSEDALRAHAQRVSAAEGEKAGVILACEMLMRLGEVTVSGEGLCRTLELLLPPDARPFILPFFEQIESIRSDGRGNLALRIKRSRDEDGRRFTIPGEKPGEKVNFWYTDDFTIHIIREGNIWRLEFGPLTTIKAGIFAIHDTYRTPLRVLRVALWIDASLLGIVLEDHADQVVVKAVAQGDVGAVRTIDVKAIPKETRRR